MAEDRRSFQAPKKVIKELTSSNYIIWGGFKIEERDTERWIER
jgi:hypothetical protein